MFFVNSFIFFVRKIPLEAVAIGDSLDWKDLSAAEITDRVLKKVKPGSIILFHNAAKHTPEALPAIIESLQKDGYKIVPVSQLIYKENFTVDNAGMQIPNSPEQKTSTSEEKATPTSASADIVA